MAVLVLAAREKIEQRPRQFEAAAVFQYYVGEAAKCTLAFFLPKTALPLGVQSLVQQTLTKIAIGKGVPLFEIKKRDSTQDKGKSTPRKPTVIDRASLSLVTASENNLMVFLGELPAAFESNAAVGAGD